MKILIAGGGTGGHFFSGLAIAQAFYGKYPGSKIAFVGTRRGIEARYLKNYPYLAYYISVRGLKGKGLVEKILGVLFLAISIFQSVWIVIKFWPNIIIGVGGYASGPVVLVGSCLGFKNCIVEQNSIPGLTNRILGKVTKRVFTSFEETQKYFKPEKICLTGNPVRYEVLEGAREGKGVVGLQDKKPFTVLIIGGSQGAIQINDAIIEALPFLEKERQGLGFIHQAGGVDLERLRQAYSKYGFDAKVETFFEDISSVYLLADLVISRAGGSAIAELSVWGQAVLFIPFPHAADNHQEVNARSLVDRGAADIISEGQVSGNNIARKILEYKNEPEKLEALRARMRDYAKPGAADSIMEECVKLVGGKL